MNETAALGMEVFKGHAARTIHLLVDVRSSINALARVEQSVILTAAAP
jgi:hypothetical protein